MSRKLDNRVIEALKHGDHDRIFRDISSALLLRFDDLLEFEFLGASHPLGEDVTFLQDGNALAIPKLRLIQAFLPARTLLMRYLCDEGQASPDEILRATAVILLMDPEHLTAANTRKRILVRQNQEKTRDALLEEKYLIDSLLTSHLHRHTKSPILWSHRRWLMLRLREAGHSPDLAGELRRIVHISGERHPRNYYAWDHARFLLRAFDHTSPAAPSQLRLTLVQDTKKWCFNHHDDTSGWSFLGFLLRECEEAAAKPMFAEVCGYAKAYTWRNESVWYFLRNLAREVSLAGQELGDFHHVIQTLASGLGDENEEKSVLLQATRWACPDATPSVGH